jgi:hypothetical protein
MKTPANIGYAPALVKCLEPLAEAAKRAKAKARFGELKILLTLKS